ncbi:MAG TPA: NAD(P)H-dependent oxidoreductase [Patescibacteria group bacterium]|nr:NAD(P)H-dependent oxidoreductase [Patescibacteria group bacterium]
MNKRIYIIVGSTRPSRIGDTVAKWVSDNIHTDNAQGNIDVEIIDLAKLDLPMLNEPENAKSRHYMHDHTKKWSQMVQKADGFIIVTPEYNASFPAPLKNALDYLYHEWSGKPMAFVGYGWGGGKRAVAHLRDVAADLKTKPLTSQVSIMLSGDILDEQGQLIEPAAALAAYKKDVEAMVDELLLALS